MPRPMLAAMIGCALLIPGGAAVAEDSLPVDQIEKIVKDYLLREPEIIYQAIQELQKRQQAEEASRQQATIAEQGDKIFRHADDPVAGNEAGDVTLVEFFDYRCGYCRNMTAGLQQLIDADPKLRFVFKELPVLGPDSVLAAKAALAAARLDESKYYDFHLALMQSKDLTLEAILATAAASGYDKEQLAAEMEQAWIQTRLDENHALAEKLGINGTPSFVIGKTLIPGAVDLGRLAQLVQDERTAAN
jgi:protein-disulfide isomerase